VCGPFFCLLPVPHSESGPYPPAPWSVKPTAGIYAPAPMRPPHAPALHVPALHVPALHAPARGPWSVVRAPCPKVPRDRFKIRNPGFLPFIRDSRPMGGSGGGSGLVSRE